MYSFVFCILSVWSVGHVAGWENACANAPQAYTIDSKTVKNDPPSVNHNAPSSPPQKSSKIQDIQDILKRGYITVGVCKIDQPPFYQRTKDGTLYGHDIDIAKEFAHSLGIEVVFNQDAENWDELVNQLEKHEIDLAISFLSKTTPRSGRIVYSNNYSQINQTILLNRLKLAQMLTHGTNTLEKIFSVKGNEKLLTYEGSSYIKFAKNLFKDVNLMLLKEQSDIIHSLIEGKAIGFITDQLETKTYLDEHPDAKLRLIPIILRENFDMIAIGVPKEYTQLLHTVNTFLEINNIFINLDKNNKIKHSDENDISNQKTDILEA